ncbi:LSU ribosomal protein L25P [Candidatus Koribacter versatilis Ellin345]|uniref:Large ribosomal subunit protein bL25 n=1 Tax=Koribacter versatilis (strain Ellin345) TaxID=204669 RepID=Q1IHW1_KORVE|nr:50S ribosomal protein L25 [Candidatus Koribacter versatilis]ABF43539.1 LSU ribosomal protein L25P [Candidatus Koribacter versatilis Ellin345]
MAITENTVTAQSRKAGGKNDARRVRKTGMVPAAVYGAGKDPVAVTVDPKAVSKILRSETGHNTIFDLAVNGGAEKVMIVDWQYEPLKGKLLHVDLKRIAMDKVLRVSVPVILQGTAEGVKNEGGILEQLIREVEIECLPADIPRAIFADVTPLKHGDNLRVKDLAHGDKLKFITDEDQMVAHVTHVKEEVVATPDAVAAEAGATPAEPEVIKKGKTEVEGAEGGDEKKAEKKK